MSQRPVRRTRQRSAVEDYLAGTGEFQTAQQIHEGLRANGESLGLATVYRTLQALADAGDVDVVRTDGEATYRQCQTGGHHHHLICRSCGSTEELVASQVESWATQMGAAHHYQDVSHNIELYGICPACSKG